MAAHLRDLDRECDHAGCSTRAVVEAFNTWNATLGRFCRSHGEALVRDLNEPARSGR